MKKKILITSKHFQEVLSKYKKKLKEKNISFDIIKSNQVVKKKQIINIIHKYHGLICSDDIVDKHVLNNAKKLKVISKWGVGINSIDIKFAKKNNIIVKNCRNVLISESTSNYVIGMILNITRKIHLCDFDLKNNKWKRYEGEQLEGKVIGVIGCGNIGKKIVIKSKVFGMKIFVNDIKKINKNFLLKYKAKQTSLDYLLRNSDIITINTDLNPSTKNLINKNNFIKMKKNTILINCARGGIVNQKDMFYALDNKIIKAAGVDVYEVEPPNNKINLKKYQNCIFSSHNAFNTKEAVDKTNELVYRNLIQNL